MIDPGIQALITNLYHAVDNYTIEAFVHRVVFKWVIGQNKQVTKKIR